mgnify:CR=1 FL=1
MGADTIAKVKWEDLEVLQSEINAIADKISDLRETISQAITVVGEDWQDDKFEDFVDAYNAYKAKMEDISNEYHRYANEVLPPFIDWAKQYDPIKTGR